MVKSKKISHEKISGKDYRNLIINAAYELEKNKSEINDLNVFPVPDGDTGSNLSLTVANAAKELLNEENQGIDEAAEKTARAMLRGARGNSGVIISLLFRGIAKGLKNTIECDGVTWAKALLKGVEDAYSAVEKPAEGTILTVAKKCAQAAKTAAEECNSFEYVLDATIKAAEKALQETTRENPVLEKAGVVDAGGMGLLVVMKSMHQTLNGGKLHLEGEASNATKPHTGADFSSYDTENITFAYCTEFIVKKKQENEDTSGFKVYLNTMGDSLVMVDDGEIIKVHIHTNEPYEVLGQALKYGEYETVKVENMRTQHTDKIGMQVAQQKKSEVKPYGFVAVASGEGLTQLFIELGADYVVSGGQTMNPSCEEIEYAVNQINADTVFVLPNNKNIIMACEQVALLSQKNIVVIPTKTVPQGISAMLGFDESTGPNENEEAMNEMAQGVSTFQVTYAARNSSLDGLDIKEGEYLALEENQLLESGYDIFNIVDTIGEKIKQQEKNTVSIYYGTDVSEYDAQRVLEELARILKGSDVEINLYNGGQPIYYFIISLE
ncbi:MAG: DAK2 domain-containing protein [Clostridia bacterium]|nr:DAK2 domain-containing protein [Clostridia bacterium]